VGGGAPAGEDQRQRREVEQRRLRQLREMSRSWAEAASIRAFVDPVETAGHARQAPRGGLGTWCGWAREGQQTGLIRYRRCWPSSMARLESVRGHVRLDGALSPNRSNQPRRQRSDGLRSVPTSNGLRFGFGRALAQDPAKPRGFGAPPALRPRKARETQTKWRCRQSGANPSLGQDP